MAGEPRSTNDRVLEPVEEVALYPDDLRTAERRWGRDARIGVALSGGGIRSATFSLGFFQGLARQKLVRHIDVLSTVSGGGYFGGFLGHLLRRATDFGFTRPRTPPELLEPSSPADPAAREGTGDRSAPDRSNADEVLLDPNSRPLKFLRENGRYLAPNGTGDLLAAAASTLRNWVSVLFVVGLLMLLIFTLLTLARFGLEDLARERMSELRWPVVWLSPFFLLVAAAIPLFVVPPGWAFWLAPDDPESDTAVRWIARWLAPLGIFALAALSLRANWDTRAEWFSLRNPIVILSFVSIVTTLRFVGGDRRHKGKPHLLRAYLSKALTRGLTVFAALLAIAVVDSIGQSIVELRNARILTLYGAMAGLVGLFRGRLLALATRLRAHESTPMPTTLLISGAAALLLLAFLGGIASVPHFVVRGIDPLPSWFPLGAPAGAMTRLWVMAGISALLVWAISFLWPFVNRSSMHELYESRLRRAYLGASNVKRSGQGEDRPPVSEPHMDDGLAWRAYDPSAWGGPIHLVNVTINETVDGRSQVQQQDRKGLGMTVGPAGVSVSRTHHALWRDLTLGTPWERIKEQCRDAFQGAQAAISRTWRTRGKAATSDSAPFRVFPKNASPELLDVGQWIAISGGAVSTGLGSRTSLGLSLLTGFFNLRLGYWWNSGVDPSDRKGRTSRTGTQRALSRLRRLLPVQASLLDEWLARFPGVARAEWNLTDGGHFENMGGYELLRRRLPLIIVCDNEQDAAYEYAGLANLVRMARVDLDAEITFLSDDDLLLKDGAMAPPVPMPDCVGSLESLRRGRRSTETVRRRGREEARQLNDGDATGLSLVHAALARVDYRSSGSASGDGRRAPGWLLYVKPSLVGDEPVDVQHYHAANPAFPHQSTADQFFDEAQWESYRRLGEHIASKLFDSREGLDNWVTRVANER